MSRPDEASPVCRSTRGALTPLRASNCTITLFHLFAGFVVFPRSFALIINFERWDTKNVVNRMILIGISAVNHDLQ